MLPRFVFADALAAREAAVRVSDRVLKCAVFIGRVSNGEFTPTATGFIVAKRYKEGIFHLIVTCAHAIIGQGELSLRLNLQSGKAFVSDPLPANLWAYHPDVSRFVDVAVLPTSLSLDIFDFTSIALEDFCDRKTAKDRDVGVGDDLFYPSLFAYHSGTGKNLPVMRGAQLAGMPIEKIQTKSGPIEAYLIEGRSISGHSGSPVFINFLGTRTYYTETQLALPKAGDSAYKLLGLIRGFIKASDVGEYITDDDAKKEDLWVNSGISTVIPAWDIYETIEQEELEKDREMAIKHSRDSSPETPTAVKIKPISKASDMTAENTHHREDFMRLLGEAAIAKRPSDQT